MVSLITGPCDTTVADYKPPIKCMPVQVTNFTPYLLDEFGEPLIVDGVLQFPNKTNIQCMVPCNYTGGLVLITLDSIDYFTACIEDWFGFHITVDGSEYWCIDNFGDVLYTKPYYNELRQEWVIPVDLLTHRPLNYTTFNWEK